MKPFWLKAWNFLRRLVGLRFYPHSRYDYMYLARIPDDFHNEPLVTTREEEIVERVAKENVGFILFIMDELGYPSEAERDWRVKHTKESLERVIRLYLWYLQDSSRLGDGGGG